MDSSLTIVNVDILIRRHPGCECPNSYRGDRCEVPHVPSGFSTEKTKDGDSLKGTTTAKEQESLEAFKLFLLILTLILVATLALCLIR